MENGNQTKKISPHCKLDIDPKATRCPHCHGKISHWSVGKILIAAFLGFIIIFNFYMFSGGSKTPTATPSAPLLTQQQMAELEAWKETPAGKLCAQHPLWQKTDCDSVIARKIWIGMTYEMLVLVAGKPEDTNVSNYGRGEQYQYCYQGHTVSCFYDNNGDGVIDSYN